MTYSTFAEDEYLDWEAGTLVRSAPRLGPEQREAIRRHLQHSLPPALLDYFSSDPEREGAITRAIRVAFEKGLVRATRQHPLPHVLTPEYVRDVYDDVVGLGPLEPLLRDPRVTSVSVLTWHTLLVERGHERERHRESFRDQTHLEQVADNLAVLSGYTLSLKVRPRMTHFSVNPPARIHIDVSSVNGPFIGFRRGRAEPWPLGEFVRRGSMSPELAELLARLARAEVPMLIVGPPGSGKTTLLEALIHELPERHLVAIEDGAFELHPDHPHVTHIVVPPRSDDEAGQTAGDMAEAAKSALRKNADQVVYGEIMDGNAGHVISNAPSFRFSATTLHGHSLEAGLARFSILAQLDNTVPRSPYVGLDNALVRADLALGFKVAVLCGRLADDRQVVREVAWIDGLDPASRNADFRLTRLATLEEYVSATGVEARWQVPAASELPPPYAVNLHAADLAAARRLAAGLTAGEAYQHALAAVHASDWEQATTFLLQAVHTAGHAAATRRTERGASSAGGTGANATGAGRAGPGSVGLAARDLPDDVAGLLRKVLQRSGLWSELAERAARVAGALQALYGARRWDTLEQALAALDADVPLALAVEAAGAGAPAAAAATPGAYGAALDLRALHQALRHGRELDAQVAARLETARHLAAHARPAEALGLLVADAPQMPLEAEHYRLLAHEAQALFDRARAELPHAQRVGLRARLDALLHLAGETVAPALAAETTLATIQKEADRTTAAIQQLASV